MHICHVTAHLPPDQAANALLPFHLGRWASEAGDTVSYVSYPPRAGRGGPQPGPVTWVRGRTRAGTAGSVAAAAGILKSATPALRRADIVHVHSNGLLAELGVLAARLLRKPVVLTLYGTEIWHYRRRSVDLFTRAYRSASQVTFYSQGLLDRARVLGLGRPGLHVTYPAVSDAFTWHDAERRAAARRDLGVRDDHLLVNVKRLHPLAGHEFLLRAMPEVLQSHPDTRLVVCGTGSLLDELKRMAMSLGIDSHVSFLGLVENQVVARWVAAADRFVLPSVLEACPTVAVEALASGTPVISTDNPGGVELHALFGDDVAIVPRESPAALAGAITAGLEAARRAAATTRAVVARDFSPSAAADRFRRIYAAARA